MKTFNEYFLAKEAFTAVPGNLEITIGDVKLKIYFDKDTAEYAVRYIKNGTKDEGKTYYTDDLDDAKKTMSAMAQRIQSGMPNA